MLHYKNKCTSYVSLALIHCITVVIILFSFRKISLLKRKEKNERKKRDRQIYRGTDGRTDGQTDREGRAERETEREKVLKRQVTL